MQIIINNSDVRKAEYVYVYNSKFHFFSDFEVTHKIYILYWLMTIVFHICYLVTRCNID